MNASAIQCGVFEVFYVIDFVNYAALINLSFRKMENKDMTTMLNFIVMVTDYSLSFGLGNFYGDRLHTHSCW
jgi:hypothetical protein